MRALQQRQRRRAILAQPRGVETLLRRGERWLLGATARGLCPVGAFYDDEAATLVGVDGKRDWVLHFAALGVVAQ